MSQPLFQKKIEYQRAKDNLIVHLGQKALTSNNREYYEQALQVVTQIEPALVVTVLLCLKHSTAEVAQIMNVQENTIRIYRKTVYAIIRKVVNIDTWTGNSLIYWYTGLVDVDAFTEATQDL